MNRIEYRGFVLTRKNNSNTIYLGGLTKESDFYSNESDELVEERFREWVTDWIRREAKIR